MDADISTTPERTDAGPDNRAVRALLAGLARALTSGDGKAAAAMWETPALVLGDDMALTVRSSAELQEVFGGAKAQYNARGITDTRPDILRLDWVTGRLAIVEVRWPYLAADGDEIGEETSTATRFLPGPPRRTTRACEGARGRAGWGGPSRSARSPTP